MYCNYVLYMHVRNNCLKASHNPTISCRRFGFRPFCLSPLWPCLLSPFRHVAVLTVNRFAGVWTFRRQTLYADNVGRFADTYNCIKTAFHDTDILADILARIARMSARMSVSWNCMCRRNVRTPIYGCIQTYEEPRFCC